MSSSHPSFPGRIKLAHWARLHDRRHGDFYVSLQEGPEAGGEDWQPMIRLIAYLKTRDPSFRLFAFIFRRRLHLTTAPGYAESMGHDTVVIGWNPQRQHYWLASGSLDHALGSDAQEEACADDGQLLERLNPLLDRLMAV